MNRMATHNGRMPRATVLAGAVVLAAVAVSVGQSSAQAQQGGAGAQPPRTPRAMASLDLTGTWVSVVTEEWRWRMLTPPKGDYNSIPLSNDGRKVADAWDPAKDTAQGNACRAYGAIGIMRMPSRLRVSWQDDATLKMEIDAGQQTRLFRFGDKLRRPAGMPGWQGFSVARWQVPGGGNVGGPAQVGGAAFGAPAVNRPMGGGSLLVETTDMKPGYLRKNGVPYSQDATLTERFFVHTAPDGNRWLTVTQVVDDPKYLNGNYISSWDFKRESNDAKFRPTPCSAS